MRTAYALTVAAAIAGCARAERVDTRAVLEPFVVAGPANMPVVLPDHAGQPLRISAGADAWIEVTPLAVRAVARSNEAGATIYRGARADADLAYTVGGRHVEELWVLHSAARRAVFRWHLTHGAGIASISPYGGGLVARDEQGVAVLHAARPFAVDASGVRRDAVLALNGDRLEFDIDLSGLRAPIVVDPVWAFDANMSVPRMVHTATQLPSGDVLVVGGVSYASGVVEHSSVERYDAKARAFVAMPAMRDARYGHSATTLASGQILVAAGSDRSTAERFDPTTSTWAVTGAMRAPRTYHVAARLADGRVLVAGGSASSKAISTAEIYDPATDAWTAVASMNVPRTYHRGVRLADGRVLVTGGLDATGSAVASTEIYTPSTNIWSISAPMSIARERHELALLPSGKALVFAGRISTTDSSTAEAYDAASNTWSAMPSLPQPSVFGGHLVLADDTIFVVTSPTGWSSSSSATFMPSKGTWSASPYFLRARRQGAAIAPVGGGILITGGGNAIENTTATTESNIPTLAAGAMCTVNSECLSGNCVDGICCEGVCDPCETCAAKESLGKCTGLPDGVRPRCTLGRCVAGACTVSCSLDSECASSRCRDGTCVARSKAGEPCADFRDCETFFCVDGVCCQSSCAGPCGTCTAPGSVGRCVFASGTPLRGECPPAACVDAVTARSPGVCDGTASTCTSTTNVCKPFACRDGACRTTCADDGDCAPENFCVAGSCRALGVPRCSVDSTTAIDARGRELPCAPFLCRGGACTDQCLTGECATGMVCFAGRCVLPGNSEPRGKFGGMFGCATRGPGESPWLAILLSLGLVCRRRAARLSKR